MQKNLTSTDFLRRAIELQGERGAEYENNEGTERSFDKIATAFNSITSKDVTPAEIALIFTLLKLVRQWSADRYHPDSPEDAVSYMALTAEELFRQYHPVILK
jgi:hypothetical protein